MFPSKLGTPVAIRTRSCGWCSDQTRKVGSLRKRREKWDVNGGDEGQEEEVSNVDRERTCERRRA